MKSQYSKLLKKGIQEFDRGNYESAMEFFDQVLSFDSTNLSAIEGKCYCLIALEQHHELRSIIDKMADQQDNMNLVWRIKGYLCCQNKEYDKAIEYFNKALDINRRDQSSWTLKGMACIKKHYYKNAVECFDHALLLSPKDKELWKQKASALGLQELNAETLVCIDKILELCPNDIFANNWKSWLLLTLNKHEEALEQNTIILELNPTNAEILATRAHILCIMNDLNESEKYANKALQYDSTLSSAYLCKGDIAMQRREFATALELYKEAKKNDSKDIRAHQGIVNALNALGLKKEAGIANNAMVTLLLLQNGYMWNLLTGEQTQETLDYFGRQSKNYNDAMAFVNKGVILSKIHKDKEAEECYKKALEIEPCLRNSPIKKDNLDKLNLYKIKKILKRRVSSSSSDLSTFLDKETISSLRDYKTIDVIHYFSDEINYALTRKETNSVFIKFAILFIIESDTYFLSIIDNENKDKERYAFAYMISLLLVDFLHINCENVAHYTSPEVVRLLLFPKNGQKASALRLSCTERCNDPSEGKTLLNYLYKDKVVGNTITRPKENNNLTFISCFTFDDDNLTHFRLYGKVHRKEATGISLKFETNLFENTQTLLITNENNTKKLSLYRCIYLDAKTGTVERISHLSETQAKLSGIEYDESRIIKLKHNVKDLLDFLKNSIQGLSEDYITPLLANLNALVKHSGYKDEQECRIVRILPKDDPDIIREGNAIFVNYLSIQDDIMKITLPPQSSRKTKEKYEKLLQKACICASVNISEHPFNNNK